MNKSSQYHYVDYKDLCVDVLVLLLLDLLELNLNYSDETHWAATAMLRSSSLTELSYTSYSTLHRACSLRPKNT